MREYEPIFEGAVAALGHTTAVPVAAFSWMEKRNPGKVVVIAGHIRAGVGLSASESCLLQYVLQDCRKHRVSLKTVSERTEYFCRLCWMIEKLLLKKQFCNPPRLYNREKLMEEWRDVA
jgi:hypothetical protein